MLTRTPPKVHEQNCARSLPVKTSSHPKSSKHMNYKTARATKTFHHFSEQKQYKTPHILNTFLRKNKEKHKSTPYILNTFLHKNKETHPNSHSTFSQQKTKTNKHHPKLHFFLNKKHPQKPPSDFRPLPTDHRRPTCCCAWQQPWTGSEGTQPGTVQRVPWAIGGFVLERKVVRVFVSGVFFWCVQLFNVIDYYYIIIIVIY